MTPRELAFVNAIAKQRDQALNTSASLQADLFELQEKFDKLEASSKEAAVPPTDTSKGTP
jgi:hypothetical protein